MKAFLFVLLATVLESTGDALVRMALHGNSMPQRVALFVVGGVLLTLYGTSLNLAPVEFAQVVGVYIATLFVMFQVTNYFFFKTVPTPQVVVGGGFIVIGGMIVALAK